MKSLLITAGTILFATIILLQGTAVLAAEQPFQFAPPQPSAEQPVAQSSGFSTQLSAIAEWEAKISSMIPQSVKDKVNEFDQMRVDLALKYSKLRDMAYDQSSVSIKGSPSKKASVEYSLGAGYYWYYALAVFFSHLYLFYGVVLLALFFILRIILRYFNIIV